MLPKISLFIFALLGSLLYSNDAMAKNCVPVKAKKIKGKKEGLYRTCFRGSYRNRINREGSYKRGKKDGQWTFYHKSGGKMSQGMYKNDLHEGIWNNWHPNGKKEAVGKFSKGKATGVWTYWHPNPHKSKMGSFKNGKKVGEWTLWHNNGRIMSKGSYKNNKEFGTWTYWHKNGKKNAESTFKLGGQLDGIQKWWHDNGKPKAVKTMVNGQDEGKCTYWRANGKKEKEGYRTKGKDSGEWTFWNKKGALEKKGTFKNGKKHGNWTWYSTVFKKADGTPGDWMIKGRNCVKDCVSIVSSKNTYKNDVLHGPSESYYIRTATGTLHQKGKYKDGAQDGKWLVYSDGVNLGSTNRTHCKVGQLVHEHWYKKKSQVRSCTYCGRPKNSKQKKCINYR